MPGFSNVDLTNLHKRAVKRSGQLQYITVYSRFISKYRHQTFTSYTLGKVAIIFGAKVSNGARSEGSGPLEEHLRKYKFSIYKTVSSIQQPVEVARAKA